MKSFSVGLAIAILAACSPGDPQADSEPSLGVAPVSDDPAARSLAEQLSEGQTMAEGMCAACHAIGASGESPHADAPPFHTLSAHYPIASLEESFAEGIIVGHPDMPVYEFEPRNIESLLAYIESVQPKDGR